VSLTEVLSGIAARHALDVQHKFVFELGWREYFRHVWSFRGTGILSSLHTGPLPEASYSRIFPADIRHAATGIPVIDMAVRTLYATGYLHNHARMWLASYVVHIRKVHWRVAADWMYAHLLDGDLASNHLSWQWVAGTGSSKPYLFNADNVARYAPPAWHSPASVIDQPYDALDRIARSPGTQESVVFESDASNLEPPLSFAPALEFGCTHPDAAAVSGKDVWLVHPWNLGEVPAALPKDAVTVGVFVTDFHRRWPWSEKRWRFVCSRMAEITRPLGRRCGEYRGGITKCPYCEQHRRSPHPRLAGRLGKMQIGASAVSHDRQALRLVFPVVESGFAWRGVGYRAVAYKRRVLRVNL